MKRRTWLLSATDKAGALIAGWGLLPQRSRTGFKRRWPPAEGEVALNGWIEILPDGSVVLAMPRSEMDQGVFTALAMLVAKEPDRALERLRLEQAGSDTIYGNVAMWVASLLFHPQELEDRPVKVRVGEWMVGKVARKLGLNATRGSCSVTDSWLVLRTAAATVRASLLGSASLQWRCRGLNSRSATGWCRTLRASPPIPASWPNFPPPPRRERSDSKSAKTGR